MGPILPTTLSLGASEMELAQASTANMTGLAWVVGRPGPEIENTWASGPVLPRTGSVSRQACARSLLQASDLQVLMGRPCLGEGFPP